MDSATAQTLESINRAFYERFAEPFHRTRGAPWPGWERVAERLREEAPGVGGSVAVLDAGCGNGRFAQFLHSRLGRPFRYLGVDASWPLLEIARRELPRALAPDLRCLDLLSSPPCGGLPRNAFDLVTAFGLFHHVPGAERRRRLIGSLGARLAPGGLLAVSFWQFPESPRFHRRVVAWERAAGQAAGRIPVEELERGDYLLAWGDQGEAVRYCHWVDAEEARDLVAPLGLEALESFRSDGRDGRSNLYCLGRRRKA